MITMSDVSLGMESLNTTKPINPNSNRSQMAGKLSKACTLKSIGVFSESEIPNLHHLHQPVCNNASMTETSARASEETITHPQLIDGATRDDSCASLDIMKIFDTISAIKLAYLQLQQAHIPYDPQKVIAADRRVEAELKKLCKFKVEYKEKRQRYAMYNVERSHLLQSEIKSREALLVRLKSQNSAKDSKILRLQQELQGLEMGNRNLMEKIKRMSNKRKANLFDVAKFQDVFKEASKSIHDFAKPLINLMKASGWDLDAAAKWVENGAVYSKRCDKKYAFEAYISCRMFHGVSLTSYEMGDVVKFDDPIDALMENPDSDFSKFCRTKFLLLVHPTMEETFFGNLDHKALVLSGKHPRTKFYQLFATMAKWIWVLLGSVVSVDPHATMFCVNRESIFCSLYMESVVEEERKSAILSEEERGTYKVQFMIMPGFRVGQTLVKSRVYISKHP